MVNHMQAQENKGERSIFEGKGSGDCSRLKVPRRKLAGGEWLLIG